MPIAIELTQSARRPAAFAAAVRFRPACGQGASASAMNERMPRRLNELFGALDEGP